MIAMKRWAALACAALALGVPAGAAGKVLLFEDFTASKAAGQPGARWTVQEEGPGWMTASVVDLDGNAVLSLQGSGVAMIGDPSWTDYTVEGDVFVFDGSYWAYAAGLLFRTDGPGTIYATDTYVYQARPNELQLEKWFAGAAWQHLVDDYGHPPATQTWQHLKVQVTGPRIQAWLDGVPTLDYVDPAGGHLHGAVGFRVWGAGAYFDNLLVTRDEPLPPGVLLSEDFSSGGLDPRWTVNDLGLAAEVTSFEGRNVLALRGTGMVTIGDLAWRDYTTEAEFYVFDDGYWAWQAGILLRASPPFRDWHSTAAYTASGRPYSQQLERFHDASGWWSYLIDTNVPVASRTWHTVKTIAEGPRFRMFVDGQLVGTAVDPQPYLQGQVGLFAYGVGAYYADLKVRENDLLAPVTTATVTGPAGEGGWLRGPATVSLAATDQGLAGVREVRVAVDGAPVPPFPGAAGSLEVAGDGRHTVAFGAVDQDLNAEVLATVEVPVDATPPVATLALSPAILVSNGKLQPVTATLDARDATSGVSSVEILVTNKDGELLGTVAPGSSIQLRGARGQRYLFTAVAVDAAGNSASATATAIVE